MSADQRPMPLTVTSAYDVLVRETIERSQVEHACGDLLAQVPQVDDLLTAHASRPQLVVCDAREAADCRHAAVH